VVRGVGMILFLLGACGGAPEFLTMTGAVFDDSDGTEAISNVAVNVFDVAFEAIDAVVSDDTGAFSVQVRFGSSVFLDLQADGYVRTGFSGAIGISDYEVPDGELWMRSEDEQDAVETAFSGCENLEDDGVIDGEILMALPKEDGTFKAFVETGWAKAVLEDGTEVEPCYLDAEGNYDPDAVYTGEQGRFLIPGVSGKVQLDVGYDLGDTEVFSASMLLYVPEDGLVTLFDVLWMPLPG
jgi:hypothetical protein